MFRRFSHIQAGAFSAGIVLFASVAIADEPVIVLHDDVAWRAMGNSGAEMAILAGDPMQAGPNSFMVRVPQGTRLPPHAHPDVWRHSTIISGTLMWALGDTFAEASMVALTPGSFWTEPSGANHYGWAWSGDVLAVGTAMGPSGMVPAPKN